MKGRGVVFIQLEGEHFLEIVKFYIQNHCFYFAPTVYKQKSFLCIVTTLSGQPPCPPNAGAWTDGLLYKLVAVSHLFSLLASTMICLVG